MKPDTILKLGDFEFSGTEVPERLSYGGAQKLSIHQLIGGIRVVDAMGEDNMPLTWTGLIMGQNADLRACYLDTQRVKGETLKLTWGEHSYRVVIQDFRAEYERYYQVPYSITCCVVADETKEMNWVFAPPVDQAMSDDMSTAGTLGDGIGDSTLSTLLKTLDTAIRTVSSFATAAQSTINTVLKPLAAVQSRVKILIAASGNTMRNVTTFGGVLPNTKASQTVGALLSQVSASSTAGYLWQLSNVLGRMSSNLGSITSSGTTQTVAGGNLFQISRQQYGNATDWTTLAKANGTTDPFISGTKTLTIPATPDDQGGILQA